MRLFRSAPDTRVTDRATWAACALLLDYPGADLDDRLAQVDLLCGHLPRTTRDALAPLRDHLVGERALVEQRYVETFDLRRRTTLYLTYWTAGDTRNRGAEMLTFVRTYRAHGADAPRGESPDHLAVVLDFAATVDADAGRTLLDDNRVGLELLRSALRDDASPYAGALDAVCATLPPVTDQQSRRAARLAAAGPPGEAVGLQPFTLTVPPRREAAAARQEGA
ncbi:nitrate reductase molybdenum cofactor assembly chaperone [Rhodococcus sp. HNM0569]|uniref:nitrate reductase molybdenum cofactor assembly chaperone n=1 Tax=Rhodococcus sp. HNM0569 TaxID=2716340 RepID=UPI00146C30E1|nr:nitrate reductase molybdenum cofactor assembly chaperone [Rhodococcus sp. HNM0569]NLU83659.1 nitrate reductase molybdenum cofactor assembly chaperone [Rhodococcus sp. HNM0569]